MGPEYTSVWSSVQLTQLEVLVVIQTKQENKLLTLNIFGGDWNGFKDSQNLLHKRGLIECLTHIRKAFIFGFPVLVYLHFNQQMPYGFEINWEYNWALKHIEQTGKPGSGDTVKISFHNFLVPFRNHTMVIPENVGTNFGEFGFIWVFGPCGEVLSHELADPHYITEVIRNGRPQFLTLPVLLRWARLGTSIGNHLLKLWFRIVAFLIIEVNTERNH